MQLAAAVLCGATSDPACEVRLERGPPTDLRAREAIADANDPVLGR
jgi:hypothetical protein